MKRIYLFAHIFFLVVSCQPVEKNNPGNIMDTAPDSIPGKVISADTPANVPENNAVPIVLARWEAFWKTKHPTFDLNDFYAAGIGEFEPYNPQPIDKMPGKNDTVAYPFSPDATWRLDVYSYKNEGEPHDVVFLIHVKTRMRYTVYYSGSGTTYEDGGWLDNNTFIVTGHEENYANARDNLVQAFYCIYHLDTKSVSYYNSKHYQRIHPSDYVRSRLKQQ